MENKEFGKLMENRTKKLAVDLLLLLRSVSNDFSTLTVKKQLIRSGSSIGANYREANHSRSKADFANKIRLCEGECNETIYWLEILFELETGIQNKITDLIIESRELLAIFSSITKSLYRK